MITLNGKHSTDHRILIDSSHDVHLVSEIFFYDPAIPSTSIGYKRRGGIFWPDTMKAVFVSSDSCGCASPRFALEESGADSLHVAFGLIAAPACSSIAHSGWMGYNTKAVATPDSIWNGVTWVTDRIGPKAASGVQMAIDASGVVH